MAAALLLAAIAVLVNSEWFLTRVARGKGGFGRVSPLTPPSPVTGPAAHVLPLAVAGLATGMAVGTKSTALAMAAALTVAVIVLAPSGRRWAAAGWWFAAAVAGGGYWYLRNLVISGNPLPQLEHLGPISLPHPERLQEGRPDFSIVHYATDTGVWSKYFEPGLHQAFGALWPLVIAAAIAGGLTALLWGQRTRSALDGRRGPVRHARLRLHPPQRRRSRGRPRRLRNKHPLRNPSSSSGLDLAAPCFWRPGYLAPRPRLRVARGRGGSDG